VQFLENNDMKLDAVLLSPLPITDRRRQSLFFFSRRRAYWGERERRARLAGLLDTQYSFTRMFIRRRVNKKNLCRRHRGASTPPAISNFGAQLQIY
jgi:hypothetical protein